MRSWGRKTKLTHAEGTKGLCSLLLLLLLLRATPTRRPGRIPVCSPQLQAFSQETFLGVFTGSLFCWTGPK